MDCKDLVIKSINGKKVKRLPVGELVLDDEVIKKSLNKDSLSYYDRLKFAKDLGVDLINLSPEYMVDDNQELSIKLDHLDIEKWVESGLFTFVILDGAFEFGMRVYGLEEFFSMVMRGGEDTLNFIKKVEKLNKMAIKELSEKGIDGIIIADDVAYQSGLMIRPKIFKDLFLPSLEEQAKTIEDEGLIPFFHSDGNYLSIMEDIINAGFKGVHCIDKKCNVSLKDFEPYKDKITLWGHLDVDYIEASKNIENMNKIVEEIKDATDCSRFILGTNSGIFPGMDILQLKKIFDKVKNPSN